MTPGHDGLATALVRDALDPRFRASLSGIPWHAPWLVLKLAPRLAPRLFQACSRPFPLSAPAARQKTARRRPRRAALADAQRWIPLLDPRLGPPLAPAQSARGDHAHRPGAPHQHSAPSASGQSACLPAFIKELVALPPTCVGLLAAFTWVLLGPAAPHVARCIYPRPVAAAAQSGCLKGGLWRFLSPGR